MTEDLRPFHPDKTVSYCPAPHRDGAVYAVTIEGNPRGVWVCGTCGRVTDQVSPDSSDRLALSRPSDDSLPDRWVVVRARGWLQGEVYCRVSFVDAPYAARESIKKLPFRNTERRWVDDWNKWVIRTGVEAQLLEQVRSDGWGALNLPEICDRGEDVEGVTCVTPPRRKRTADQGDE